MNNSTTVQRVPDGRYTILYSNGEYRTIQLTTVTDGDLAGKQIFALPGAENKFNGVAFVTDAGLAFWKKFRTTQTPERLQRIARAYQIVANDPAAAGKAYGHKSGHCYRCFRELTTPASLAAGIGPDCAGKLNGWTKEEQRAAAHTLRAEIEDHRRETAAQ